ncbi:hypothetical protein SAMN02745158_02503 [Lactonifactor longoviformis DSM 17459]|uniref:Uncharacterized protein n=1 Tax=Lactonifactor longoviformis DSM 17459 TaxID=1122155 RepID=A0A1M4YT68_9CLOT|nr:hypothetical protein SAMN02745158_02503 [Lactonifactor longoviformis DSM 17459]
MENSNEEGLLDSRSFFRAKTEAAFLNISLRFGGSIDSPLVPVLYFRCTNYNSTPDTLT